jgi:hypothetical protein
MLKLSPELFNHTTNAAGLFIGGPQIMQGVQNFLEENYPLGIYNIVSGAIAFVAFYFMGK